MFVFTVRKVEEEITNHTATQNDFDWLQNETFAVADVKAADNGYRTFVI